MLVRVRAGRSGTAQPAQPAPTRSFTHPPPLTTWWDAGHVEICFISVCWTDALTAAFTVDRRFNVTSLFVQRVSADMRSLLRGFNADVTLRSFVLFFHSSWEEAATSASRDVTSSFIHPLEPIRAGDSSGRGSVQNRDHLTMRRSTDRTNQVRMRRTVVSEWAGTDLHFGFYETVLFSVWARFQSLFCSVMNEHVWTSQKTWTFVLLNYKWAELKSEINYSRKIWKRKVIVIASVVKMQSHHKTLCVLKGVWWQVFFFFFYKGQSSTGGVIEPIRRSLYKPNYTVT